MTAALGSPVDCGDGRFCAMLAMRASSLESMLLTWCMRRSCSSRLTPSTAAAVDAGGVSDSVATADWRGGVSMTGAVDDTGSGGRMNVNAVRSDVATLIDTESSGASESTALRVMPSAGMPMFVRAVVVFSKKDASDLTNVSSPIGIMMPFMHGARPAPKFQMFGSCGDISFSITRVRGSRDRPGFFKMRSTSTSRAFGCALLSCDSCAPL